MSADNKNNTHFKQKGLGWKPDIPDVRDHIYAAPQQILKEGLPSFVDLRQDHKDSDGACGHDEDYQSNIPKYINNQLVTNSCVGQSTSMDYESTLLVQDSTNVFTPSKLFIYYNARKAIGQEGIDEGCVIRDAFKSINRDGVVSEADWPFDPNKVTVEPPSELYEKAKDHQVIEYKRIPRSLDQMKGCLAEGYPFVFGFSVYESFYDPETVELGKAHLPVKGDRLLGGHAVICVGYNDADKTFICINSWGKDWGDNGCFTIPYDYLLNENLSDDFWSVRKVEDSED